MVRDLVYVYVIQFVSILKSKIGSSGQVRIQNANKSMLWRPASTVARLDVLAKGGHCSETEGSAEKATTVRKSARIANKNNTKPTHLTRRR